MEGNILFIIGQDPKKPIHQYSHLAHETNAAYCHLGHELAGARALIMDLLSKDVIKKDKTTILTLKDRMFLYEHLFNTISHEDNELNPHIYNHIINLTKLAENPRDGLSQKNYFHNITNNKFIGKYEPIGFNNYKNEKFIEYMTNCNSEKYSIFSSDFIIIHYRNYRNNPVAWNQTTNETKDFLYNILENIKLKTIYKNVLIFGNLEEKIIIDGLNINQTHNLKLFTSNMKSENCKMIISSWSGAGQLGNLFFNNKILFYHVGDQIIHETGRLKDLELYNNNLKDPYSWDYQIFSKSKRFFFKDKYHLLDLFNKDYFNKLDEIYNKYIGTEKWVSLDNL